METVRVKPLIGDAEDGEFWKTAMPGACGLFNYVEDDGWPEKMLVRRIGGLCVFLVLMATLVRFLFLE